MNLILPAKYYTFSDFDDPDGRESGGDSGKILVAEKKVSVQDDCPVKLLIKHEFSNDPCNEFMASRLASFLDISAPEVYLVNCPAWKKNGFHSRFMCAIKYMDNLRRLTQEEIQSRDGGMFVASVYGLSALLHQNDQISLGISSDGFCTYDFTETFMLINLFTDVLLENSIVGRRGIWLTLQANINDLNMEYTLLPVLRQNWKELLNIVGESNIEEKKEAFLRPVRRFPDAITDERIDLLTETIRKYYGGGAGEVTFYNVKAADVLAWYYKEYLVKFRQMCIEAMNMGMDGII